MAAPKKKKGAGKRAPGSAPSPPSLKQPAGAPKGVAGEKARPSTPPKRAKSTISKDKTAASTPLKSLKSTSKRDMMEIIGSAPKVPGVFQEPQPRDRNNDYLVSIAVEMAMKPEAMDLACAFNRGQHVVAIFVPLNDVSEWPMWKAFDTGEILQAHHGSDFERTFEVTTRFMAEMLDVSDRRLQQLHQMKHAKKFGRGRWDLVGTFKAYLDYIREEFQGRGGKEYSSQRTRKLTASADREEVKLAQENEELGYLEDFESEQMELSLQYREAMERLPEAIAERLVKKPVHAIKRELAEEIKSILEQLSIQASKPNGSNTGQAKAGRKKKAPKPGGRKKRSA